MSEWTPLAQGFREEPAEAAAREARHQVLIELLAAYADRELPPETTSQIDAHLVGCARCRRELALHNTVRGRLEAEPIPAAPSALRDRVVSAIAATPVPAPPRARPVAWRRRLLILAGLAAFVPAVGVAAGYALRARWSSPALSVLSAPPASVPLLGSVLADYRRVVAGNLPGRARDLDIVRAALPFPVEALRTPGVRLVAAWTTDIDGDPAAVLAYRWNDRIVLEYLVSEERFFESPGVRQAVTDGRVLAATDAAQGIVAWPTNAAGAVLVGDVAPSRLAKLSADDILARKTTRGAP